MRSGSRRSCEATEVNALRVVQLDPLDRRGVDEILGSELEGVIAHVDGLAGEVATGLFEELQVD